MKWLLRLWFLWSVGVVVALISKIGYDNKKDHGIVHKALGRIEEKIDNHVENHR
jgi:hypothetical protein